MAVRGSPEVVQRTGWSPSLPSPELFLSDLVFDKAAEHALTVVIVIVEVLHDIARVDIIKAETVSLRKLFNHLPIIPDGSEAAAERLVLLVDESAELLEPLCAKINCLFHIKTILIVNNS